MAELIREESIKKIVEKIAASKKYRPLYRKTIERVVLDCAKRYPTKEAEKRSKNLLHQIWGIFYPTRPNFKKLAERFEESIKIVEGPTSHNLGDQMVRETVLPILKLHASTKERIPVLNNFYRQIFEITGQPKTILDLASGLNPLTYFWLPKKSIRYLALDIDQEQNDFLRSVFRLLKVKNVKIKTGDVFAARTLPRADVVFLFKILPLLAHQQKESLLKLLGNLRCQYLVVSFPTKTVSGKEKGMAEFYAKQFEELIKQKPWQVTKILFPTELVFIVNKQNID